MEKRLKRPKDLGELMVIAHAVVAAEAGQDVTVLIDDGARDRLASTLTVLERAAGGQDIPDKATMRDIYSRLRALDDGLPPVGRTNLLSSPRWS